TITGKSHATGKRTHRGRTNQSPPIAFTHARKNRTKTVVGAIQMYIEHAIPLCFGHLSKRYLLSNARIAQQNINGAEFTSSLCHCLYNFVKRRNVNSQRKCPTAKITQL